MRNEIRWDGCFIDRAGETFQIEQIPPMSNRPLWRAFAGDGELGLSDAGRRGPANNTPSLMSGEFIGAIPSGAGWPKAGAG
jgi:hypothetical protein